MSPTAWLVKGDDPSLVAERARGIVKTLLGEEDPTLATVTLDADSSPQAISDALGSPPLFSERRVVLVRQAGALGAEAVQALIQWCKAPSEFALLVLAAGGGAISQKLTSAVKACGEVVDANPPKGAGRHNWFAQEVKAGPVKLDASAVALASEHLGSDVARLSSLLETLAATYGPSAKLGRAELEPFLGSEGDVAPWDLTDAIERGDIAAALGVMKRMLANGRHPLALLAVLQRSFSAALALQGRGELSESEAASLAGIAPFAARKALSLSRRLGKEKVFDAIDILASADLDLRGATGLDPELVMEVAVARLARICSSSRPRRSGSHPARARRAQ